MKKNAHHPTVAKFIRRTIEDAKFSQRVEWREVASRLKEMGVIQDTNDLTTKFSKGQMQAELYLALLLVLKVETLDITPLRGALDDTPKQPQPE